VKDMCENLSVRVLLRNPNTRGPLSDAHDRWPVRFDDSNCAATTALWISCACSEFVTSL